MPIRFDTNDDPILLFIASGAYTGTPDAHLVYINYIYGLLLQMLYTSIGGVEWYTVCLSAIHVLCLSVITWRISHVKVDRIWKILWIAILYMLEMQIVVHFQYTTTAALCGTASVMLFLTGNNIQRYMAALLFTLGTLIRFDPAYLAALIFTPTIIYFLLKQKNKIKALIPLSLFIILSLSAYLIDKKVYDGDPKWKDYKEFNYYRGRISDNPNAFGMREGSPVLSESDFMLLRSFFPDTEVITTEKAKKTYEYVKDISFGDKLKNVYDKKNGPNLARYQGILIAFFLFGIFIAIVHQDQQKKYLILISTFLMLLALIYVTLEAFLWHRVLMSAMIPFCLMMVYVCSSLTKKRTVQITILLLVGTIVFLGGDVMNKRRRKLKERAKTNLIIEQSLSDAKLLKKEEEQLISFISIIRAEQFSPYALSEFYRNNPFVILSWLSKSPFNNEHNINSYLDLIGQNILNVEDWALKEPLTYLKRSIKENYGIEVRVDTVSVRGYNYLLRLERDEGNIE